MPKHTVTRIAYRYLSGRPLDGKTRTDCGYLRPGKRALTVSGHASRWAMLPGWRRQAYRLGIPAGVYGLHTAYTTQPVYTTTAAVAVAALGGVHGYRRLRRRWRMRRFHNTYIKPTLAALAGTLGDAPVKLHVSPDLGNLVPWLAKPMSPAEKAIRAWYGQHVEPIVRWLPDHAMRAMWTAQKVTTPLSARLEWFRAPRPEAIGPSIELTTSVPYLTAEQRGYISAVIGAKIPVSDLVERWDQVGPKACATWTVRKRPPARVGYNDLDARMAMLAEWQFFLGLGVGGKPVTIDLKTDSPHVAVSASTGAGKSELAHTLGIQNLARGGQVVILDIKGSHRWALGLPAVTYCTTVAQIHDALVRMGDIAADRNSRALTEPEDWDPGIRYLIILEEVNSTLDMLLDYWAETRSKGESRKSPAVRALKQILSMGRSAKVNIIGIAQMLTARSIGGPEARENFAIRCLARYSVNNWKMLVPEAGMPRVSRTLGRWQIVVAGTATECQVAYLTAAESRLFLHKHAPVSPTTHTLLIGVNQETSPGHEDSGDIITPVDPLSEAITLRDAVQRGIAPWAFDATKKRLQRARKAGRSNLPAPVGRDGTADLYRVGDLIIWIESELVP